MTSIAVDCVDGVGHLKLNRANALNALDLQFCTEIDDALLALDAREEVRAILISTSLKHFCAVSGNRAAFLPTSSAGGDRIEADWPRSVASTALG